MSTLSNLPTEINKERLVNSKQAAEFTNNSLQHWRRLCREGKAPAPIKIGERKHSWRLGTLIDFIAEKQAQA